MKSLVNINRCLFLEINKEKFVRDHFDKLVLDPDHQPKLCTQVSGRILSRDPGAVLYTPRALADGHSVVCHLGEVHLGRAADGKINNFLELEV